MPNRISLGRPSVSRMPRDTVIFLRAVAIATIAASIVMESLMPNFNLLAGLGISAGLGIALALCVKIAHII